MRALTHILFDLDGTLVDSVGICADIVNSMLADRGVAHRISRDRALSVVSTGGTQMMVALLGDHCGDPDQEIADFRARYATLPTSPLSLYPGVRAGLAALKAAGLTMAICSNKPQALCEKVLGDLGIAHHFAAIVGGTSTIAAKPAPDLIHHALARIGGSAATACLIGDSEADHQAAIAAGLPFILADWGYAAPHWDFGSVPRCATFAEVPDAVSTLLSPASASSAASRLMAAPRYSFAPHIAAQIAASHHRIVITGASGWLGMAILELLHDALGAALADRVMCLGSQARALTLMDGTTVAQRPMTDLPHLSSVPTMMLHLAFLTKDKVGSVSDETYCAANQRLTTKLMSALDTIGTTALYYPSSGAAAQAEMPDATDDMRLYGGLKLADEQRFAQWSAQTGHPVVISRIFNLSGPHINKPETYALSSFIADALAGRPIVVRATRPVMRSYVAIREMMGIVFARLLDPASGVTHMETGSEQALDVRDLAALVANAFGGTVDAAPLDQTAAPEIYLGNATAYAALRDAHGIMPVSIGDQLRDTAATLHAHIKAA